MGLRPLLPALLAAAAMGADTLHVEALGLARRDGLLRAAVTRPVGADLAGGGPVRLAAELRDGPDAVAATAVELPRLGLLARGVILVLVPDTAGDRPLRLLVNLTRPGRPGGPPVVETAATDVATPGSTLAAAAAAAARLREAGETDALPWLWAEQAADCAAGGASALRVGEVATLTRRIDGWLTGSRPSRPDAGTSAWALRDPVDGSVQPFRLHLPPGPGPFPAAVLEPAPAPGLSKAHWPPPPGRWLAAAAEAGVAVIECYPAGDRAWNGAAARRVPLAVAAARLLAPLAPAAPAVIGAGRSDAGDLHADDPGWWRALPMGHAAEPPMHDGLASVLDAPFAVVVGGAEHAAARRWNRELADAFRAAYAAHAHAIPPELADDLAPEAYTGRNLVLIGNPRSNRVLARLAPALPVAWDDRAVRAGDFAALRASRPSVACLADLADGHLALVLDGSPPPWGSGLPLAGLRSPWLHAGP